LLKQATHWSAWQMGVGEGQSLFWTQTTHEPSGPQIGPGREAQSEFARHSTHDDVLVSQSGVSCPQFALLVHPARQVKSCGSQMGFAVPQSALLRHSTHWPAPGKQRGAVAGQSPSAPHATQLLVVASQMGWSVGQSELALHWTQTPPDDASQVGVSLGQSPFWAHVGWHWWSPGQHDGIAAPQSAFVRHATHWPVGARHSGAGCPQSPFVRQSTHPSAALHVCPP
jgi:hypothetical protein